MDKRIQWVDSLKGIAICAIVASHYTSEGLPDILAIMGSINKNGVQLFLLITSFLCFVSLEKKLPIVVWWKNKFLRLFPAFIMTNILCLVIRGGNTYWLGNQEYVTMWNLLSHIFLLHGFFPHYTNSIIGVEWYVGLIVIFYLLAPVVHRFINSIERAVLAFAIGTFGCYEINKYASMLAVNMEDAYIYLNYVGTFWIFAQLPVLLLGIVLYYVVKSNFIENIEHKKMVSISFMIMGIILLAGMMLDQNSLYGFSNVTLFGIAFSLVILSQVLYPWKSICNKCWKLLGQHSYVIYLMHVLFIHIYLTYFKITTENALFNWVVGYIIVVGVSLLSSLIWTNSVEKLLWRVTKEKERKNENQ